MQYQSFLIKYAEIGIKGKNRYIFEDDLVNQIKIAVRKCDGKFHVSRTSGRIFVDALEEYDYDQLVDALQHVFGIVGICPVAIREVLPYDELSKAVTEFFGEEYPDRHHTFKVMTRRLAKKLSHGFTGTERVARGRSAEGLSGTFGGCAPAGDRSACGTAGADLSVYAYYPGTRRTSGRQCRQSHAAAFRRHRLPGVRMDDGQARASVSMPYISTRRLIPVSGRCRK
jgi:hypothetical protein